MRRVVLRQLQLVFADSPTRGGDDVASGVPEGTASLLHTAGARGRARTTTGTTTLLVSHQASLF